jgi:hypothetical protein
MINPQTHVERLERTREIIEAPWVDKVSVLLDGTHIQVYWDEATAQAKGYGESAYYSFKNGETSMNTQVRDYARDCRC